MFRFFMLTIILTTLLSQLAHACFAPPKHMYVNHDAAIKDAEWIVLATAQRLISTDGGMVYKMRAIEYIKGEGPETFILENGIKYAARGDSRTPDEGNY
ncbi:MAG: hypothetical protein AAGK66_01950 [Pseudomonadota bacterium]